jgi:hypothetical protein
MAYASSCPSAEGGQSRTAARTSRPSRLVRSHYTWPHHAFAMRGAIAQLGERLDRTQEVGGSSPPSSIHKVPAKSQVLMIVQTGPKGGVLLMGPFTGPIADGAAVTRRLGDRHDGRRSDPSPTPLSDLDLDARSTWAQRVVHAKNSRRRPVWLQVVAPGGSSSLLGVSVSRAWGVSGLVWVSAGSGLCARRPSAGSTRDIASIEGALHNLAEQHQDRVDRAVRQRSLRALVFLPVPRRDRSRWRTAADGVLAVELGAIEVVSEVVDPGDVDLQQLEFSEAADEIAELSLHLSDRVLVETLGLHGVDDPASEGTERLMTVGGHAPRVRDRCPFPSVASRYRAAPVAGSVQPRFRPVCGSSLDGWSRTRAGAGDRRLVAARRR